MSGDGVPVGVPYKQATHYADGVYGPDDLAAIWNACVNAHKTLAQQPAAVDGVLQRAAEALLTARSHTGACRPDDGDEDDQAWWDELTELAAALAALAAQPGGEA